MALIPVRSLVTLYVVFNTCLYRVNDNVHLYYVLFGSV